MRASANGTYPVLCDQSPCLYRMRHTNELNGSPLKLYEPAEFIELFVLPEVDITPLDLTVAVHPTCSTRKMGLTDCLVRVAKKCTKRVVVPEEVGCCAFAGDKGFTHPELNAWALRKLRKAIQTSGATIGYSNSRTCEIGLTTHSGIEYMSIVYLVNQAANKRK